jgi:tetratricopeptide (TPR) repeat protein
MAKRKQKREETLVDIVEAREQAQNFFEQHQLKIIGVIAAILVIIGGYYAYKYLYQIPKQAEAEEQIFQAQVQFERDSFVLALENPGGGYPGFLDIVSDYKGTPAANSARYYAGISYLNLGRYDDAEEYLSKFKPVGKITPIMKFGALGDIYSERGDMNKALSMYKKAGSVNDNDFLAPYYLNKYALLSLKQGDNANALKTFKRIKADFPLSSEAQDADKYIARLAASN